MKRRSLELLIRFREELADELREAYCSHLSQVYTQLYTFIANNTNGLDLLEPDLTEFDAELTAWLRRAGELDILALLYFRGEIDANSEQVYKLTSKEKDYLHLQVKKHRNKPPEEK